MSDPLISVILPFFQSARTVVRAVRSILRQTLPDLEIIAIDDGSSDGSYDRVAAVRDPRHRVYRNERNMGVFCTRNRAMELCRGRFIAPMDADDTCPRQRLEWLAQVLHDHPDVVVCGGWMRVHRSGHLPYVARYPTRPPAVNEMLLWEAPFCCASVLFRADPIPQHGLRYPEDLAKGEDLMFLRDLLRYGKGMNVPRVVYHYRVHPRGLSTLPRAGRIARDDERFGPALRQLLGREATPAELALHSATGRAQGAPDARSLAERHAWILNLLRCNERAHVYEDRAMCESSAMIWFRNCRNSAHLGCAAWKAWRSSPLAGFFSPTAAELIGFWGSMLRALRLTMDGHRK